MAGKIKSEKAVKTEFKYIEENEEWVESKSYTISYSEFDNNGNMIIEKAFNSVGEFHEFNEYQYDEKGFLIEKVIYLDEDEVAERAQYTNDETGKPLKKTTIYQESSEDYTEYFYNAEGNIIEKIRKDDDGYVEEREAVEYEGKLLVAQYSYGLDNVLLQKSTFKYDEAGNSISNIYEDYLGSDRSRIDYAYNEAGLKEKMLTYNSEGHLVSKTLYEYDEKKRIVEVIEEDRTSYKMSKMTYNDNDNVILQEEFDKEDNLTLSIDRTYNEAFDIVKSAVFIESSGQEVAQYYEVDYEYELTEE